MLYTQPRFTVRSEYVRGADGLVTRAGYYAQALFKLWKPLDAVFRSDVFDPDTRSEDTTAVATERDWLGGVNYQIAPTAMVFQFNYVRKTYAVGASRNVVLANLQTSW